MKHCCVEDPVDLCSVNIAGKELSEFKEEDFQLFDNVAYVNAAENYLPFGKFTLKTKKCRFINTYVGYLNYFAV